MHNFSDWVQVFAGAVGTLVTALAVSHKTNRADYDAIIKGKDDIISDLKKERDKYQQLYYSEIERKEKAEEKTKILKDENEVLKKFKKQKNTRP